MANRLVSAVTGTARVVGESYRLGLRAWVAAPVIVAVAVVPEFIQHVVEIKLGMFVSVEQFRELANHPNRWLSGYAKIAGMVVALLAIARFWAVGSVRQAFLLPRRDLIRLALAVVLTIMASLPFDWIAKQNYVPAFKYGAQIVSFLIQAGLMLYVASALFGDRTLTLRTAFTQRWPTGLVVAISVLCTFLPAQLLHMLNHKLALGQPPVIVWALMIWDSLVVGMIATLVGSALWAAYRSGATWRGWGRDTEVPAEAMIVGQGAEDAIDPAPAPEPPPARQRRRGLPARSRRR